MSNKVLRTESSMARLSPKVALFVREFAVDFNGKQAAIRAGYASRSAEVQASRLLSSAKVQAALAELQASRVERLEIDADERVRRLKAIADMDANALTRYIRHCCPFCWGEDHARQYLPSEFAAAKKQHEMDRAGIMAQGGADIGEFSSVEGDWWDQRKDPNPDCPECFGHGQGKFIINDTRKLSPIAKAAFEGVKKTKDGIEVMTFGKAKAEEMLLRSIGAFRDREPDINIVAVDMGALSATFHEKMAQARERQRRVLEERGLPLNAEDY